MKFELNSEQELIQQTMRIIRNRIDPSGVLEPIIRQEGDNIVVEIPGAPEFSQQHEPPPSLQDMVHTAPATGAAASRRIRSAAVVCLTIFLAIL